GEGGTTISIERRSRGHVVSPEGTQSGRQVVTSRPSRYGFRSMASTRTYLLGILMSATGCASDTVDNSERATSMTGSGSEGLEASARGPNIAITFRPLNNLASSDGSFFSGSFTLRNQSGMTLGARGWQIYFSYYPRSFLNDGEGNAQYKQHLAEQG